MLSPRRKPLVGRRLRVVERRAGDRSVVAKVRWERRRLAVRGAWAFDQRGELIVFVFDDCYTDEEILTYIDLVKIALSLDD